MSGERDTTAIDRRLGQRVRTRRLEIGMSQERLAELLGVTFQQVQKYERGVNRMAASRLFVVASALDMPISRFFDGLENDKLPKSDDNLLHDTLATVEGAQLMAMFASLKSMRVRRRVLDLVRAITEENAPERK